MLQLPFIVNYHSRVHMVPSVGGNWYLQYHLSSRDLPRFRPLSCHSPYVQNVHPLRFPFTSPSPSVRSYKELRSPCRSAACSHWLRSHVCKVKRFFLKRKEWSSLSDPIALASSILFPFRFAPFTVTVFLSTTVFLDVICLFRMAFTNFGIPWTRSPPDRRWREDIRQHLLPDNSWTP